MVLTTFHYIITLRDMARKLRVDRLLGEYRIPKDSVAGREVLEQAVEARRGAEAGAEYKAIRRGWCLGEESFRKELLAQMTERRVM